MLDEGSDANDVSEGEGDIGTHGPGPTPMVVRQCEQVGLESVFLRLSLCLVDSYDVLP